MTPYLDMAANNEWANATLYASLRKMDAQSFAAPRSGFFGSLLRTMNHIYEVDLYYLDALENGGLGRAVYDRADVTTPSRLADLQAGADARLVAFCKGLTPALLEAPRTTERKEETVTEKVGPLLVHLFQHQVHHRGQAHVMLSEAGLAPPQLDDFHLTFGRVPSAEDSHKRHGLPT